MNRPIKFRALLAKGKNRRWVYYSTFEIPFIDDGSWDAIIVKDSQSVGLTDKNGKEIYEGDMVVPYYGKKPTKGYPCIVDWRSNTGFHPFVGTRIGNEQWEVIGNIFENPELLTPTS